MAVGPGSARAGCSVFLATGLTIPCSPSSPKEHNMPNSNSKKKPTKRKEVALPVRLLLSPVRPPYPAYKSVWRSKRKK